MDRSSPDPFVFGGGCVDVAVRVDVGVQDGGGVGVGALDDDALDVVGDSIDVCVGKLARDAHSRDRDENTVVGLTGHVFSS